MKTYNLVLVLSFILTFMSFVSAQTFDWAITSPGKLVDEGNSVRPDLEWNRYFADNFSSDSLARRHRKSISSVLKNDTVALNAKLMASDATNSANFGSSVAISGDTAVIGAYQHNLGTKRAQGAVYVFVRTKENVWIQQAKLVAADGSMKDYFGQCVAIDGDTIVVGVPQADIGKDKDQGAVYVFTRTGNHWAEQVKLKATGGAATDIFGQSIGISGDTIIVGAPGTDTNPNDKLRTANGAAYIFTRNNNVWSEKQKLTGDNPTSVAFGMNAAIDNKTAVVSNIGDVGTSAAIYVFTNEGTGWKQEGKISSPRDADEKVLGNSISNNLAIDGGTIVVGGSQKGGKSNTAVYVYVHDNGKWTRQAKLTPSDGVKDDLFGWTVDISGDTVIVGAWANANQGRGAAYLFNRKRTPTGIVWVEEQKLTAADSLLGDLFGGSVGINNNTIIIGANNHDLKNRNSNEGAAYIFSHSALVVNASLQRSNQASRIRKILLVRNARKNGYTTKKEGNTIYFQANNVEDPLDGKPLEGEKKLEYRCTQNGPPLIFGLKFFGGSSERKRVDCLAMITPRIIIQEEEEQE